VQLVVIKKQQKQQQMKLFLVIMCSLLLRTSSFVARSGAHQLRWFSSSTLSASTAIAEVEGSVEVKVTQRKYPIDKQKIISTTLQIKRLLGVPEFQVDVLVCSDNKIREMNDDWRGKSKSTDCLSFPANEFVEPGVFEDDPSLEFEQHLGDIVIAPDYVWRQCKRDELEAKSEQGLDTSSDAGVSKAMASDFTLDGRIDLLLVHSMLHLLGYDHETDEDWKIMTDKEQEIMNALRRS